MKINRGNNVNKFEYGGCENDITKIDGGWCNYFYALIIIIWYIWKNRYTLKFPFDVITFLCGSNVSFILVLDWNWSCATLKTNRSDENQFKISDIKLCFRNSLCSWHQQKQWTGQINFKSLNLDESQQNQSNNIIKNENVTTKTNVYGNWQNIFSIKRTETRKWTSKFGGIVAIINNTHWI